MPWFEASFAPEPAFEDVRPLFDHAQALVETEPFDAEAWEETWKRVRSLGVRLVPSDGSGDIDEFAMYVDGATCRFRY
jgi:hypothetical protein